VKQPIRIEGRDAIALHDRLLALHGGSTGLRDELLLESGLAGPRQALAYAVEPDLFELAAAYTAGIVGNHPFVDGNKRTGFVVGILFLELNGLRFTAPEEDAARAVLNLAAGTLDAAEYAHFLRGNARRTARPRR
jgi:death on curing protein